MGRFCCGGKTDLGGGGGRVGLFVDCDGGGGGRGI